MGQSFKLSLIESKVNAALGLIISWLFTLYGLPFLFEIETNAEQATGITACYFLLSLFRSLIIRRVFNGI